MNKDIPDNISYHPTHPLGKNPDELKEKFAGACLSIVSFYVAINQKKSGEYVDDDDLNIDKFHNTVQEMRETFNSLKLVLEHNGKDVPESICKSYKASEKLITNISTIEL